MAKPPHLTPQSLVGRRFPRDVFGGAKIALIGYCPPPEALERYAPERTRDQHFIHVSPDSVRMLSHKGRKFLSLAHVYGGPVSTSTVEELAYYGFETILAYGLAGGLGTKGLAMGDAYLVADAFSADGATRHYSSNRFIASDAGLRDKALTLWSGGALTPVRAATGDAIYREDDAMLDAFRSEGCDIVNLDSAHLYAAACENAERRVLPAIQCGVISDVAPSGAASESTLAVMLAEGAQGPLDRVGDILSWYVETLGPSLGD